MFELPAAATKEAANYRPANDDLQRCISCAAFQPPAGCTLVQGEIAEDAVCDLFESSAPAMPGGLF